MDPSPGVFSPKGKDRTVLVVDDDVQNAAILAETLTAHGYQPLVAHSLSRAVQLAANQRFLCMVVDMFLGTERGARLVQQVRRNKTDLNHFTPIVAMSGAFDAGVVTEIRGMIDAAVVKPFPPRDLMALLARMSESQGVRDAIEALRGTEEKAA
ncbi:MAG: response regulator [Bdellovibrionales bacterium]|nr:response regulator [Bdellovibrionales bacterium]